MPPDEFDKLITAALRDRYAMPLNLQRYAVPSDNTRVNTPAVVVAKTETAKHEAKKRNAATNNSLRRYVRNPNAQRAIAMAVEEAARQKEAERLAQTMGTIKPIDIENPTERTLGSLSQMAVNVDPTTWTYGAGTLPYQKSLGLVKATNEAAMFATGLTAPKQFALGLGMGYLGEKSGEDIGRTIGNKYNKTETAGLAGGFLGGMLLGSLKVPNIFKSFNRNTKFEPWMQSEPLTSSKWDIEYNKAIQAGNINRVQAIRDAHYLRSVPHTEITVSSEAKPVTWYHGTEYGGHSVFNSSVSNATIGGASAQGVKGNFLTTDLKAAQNYANGSHFVDPAIMHSYTDKYVTDLMDIHSPQYEKMQNEYNALRAAGKVKEANKLYNDFMKQHPTAEESVLQRRVVYPFYVNPQKIATYDFKGNPWSALPEDLPTQYYVRRQWSEVTPAGVVKRTQSSPLTFDLSEAKKVMEDSGLSVPVTMYEGSGKSSIFGVGKPYDRSSTIPEDRYGVFEQKYPNTTNGAVQYSANQGYDSILMKDVVDANPKSEKNYAIDDLVTLKSNQMKLASPITYDDNGNIIPISKRDDWTNPDVRYEIATSENSNTGGFWPRLNQFFDYRKTFDPLNTGVGLHLSPQMSRKFERFIPTWLKAPKIEKTDIDTAIASAKRMYDKLPKKYDTNINPYYVNNNTNVTFLPTYQYAKANPKSPTSSAFQNGAEGIVIHEPSIVWPWQRSLYKRNTLGTIAHEAGHSQQITDFHPDIVKYGHGNYYSLKNNGYEYVLPYLDKAQNKAVVRPATAYDKSMSDYEFANHHFSGFPMWIDKKIGKWAGSPNELISEVDKLREMGYVTSNGSINEVGMNALTKRFGVDKNAISGALERLKANYEYTPYQYRAEYMPSYADKLRDWFALNTGNLIRDTSIIGTVGGSGYFVGKKLKEKNE